MKLKDLINSQNALNNLTQQPTSARMSFALGGVIRQLSPHFDSYLKEHKHLLEKHGITPNAKPEDVEQETLDAFNTEYNDLIEAEMDLTTTKIKLSDIERGGLRLSGQDAYVLSWLITDDIEK